MSKQLLLGDEAIAQAALDAGLSGVYAYPGTPSTEITEYIQMAPITAEKNIHNRWCSNEKTAMEAALGMSFAGKRSLVCMKHVGMNVAADCFIRRSDSHCCRRPQHALLTKRARQPLLWRLLPHPDVRTKQPAGSIRHGVQRIQLLRTDRRTHPDAHGYAPGTLPFRRRAQGATTAE